MKPIFISYSRKDSGVVYSFVERIEKGTSVKCWIDRSGIASGASFGNEIVEGMNKSSVVLFMLSDNSIKSEYSQKEIMYAKTIGKTVIPVILDDGALRDWFLFEFGNRNFIRYNNEADIQKLFVDIKEWCSGADIPCEESEQLKNPLIQEAISNIIAGNDTFEFIFRDYKFKVKIIPMVKFVLDYCRCSNNTEELKSRLETVNLLDESAIDRRIAMFEPDTSSFAALLSSVNPRFALHVKNEYCLKVLGTDGFKDAPVKAAKELFEACKEFRVTKETIITALQRLIGDPFSYSGKSAVKDKIDKYVEDYLPHLEKMLEFGGCRIHFKGNEKYNCDSLGIYYIGFDDIYAYNLNIREKVGEKYEDTKDPVIAHYSSPIDILKDGWRLD